MSALSMSALEGEADMPDPRLTSATDPTLDLLPLPIVSASKVLEEFG